MKKAILVASLVLIVGLALSCSKSEEKVVARLGEDVITAGMVKDEYLAISAGARPVLATIEEQEQFVRDVLSKEMLEREAVKMGLERAPRRAAGPADRPPAQGLGDLLQRQGEVQGRCVGTGD